MPPLRWRLVHREDRLNRARRDARAAIDTFARMNVKHIRRIKGCLVLTWMDAVDGADIYARGILHANAGLADNVRHS